jgi:hypothetical protein
MTRIVYKSLWDDYIDATSQMLEVQSVIYMVRNIEGRVKRLIGAKTRIPAGNSRISIKRDSVTSAVLTEALSVHVCFRIPHSPHTTSLKVASGLDVVQ